MRLNSERIVSYTFYGTFTTSKHGPLITEMLSWQEYIKTFISFLLKGDWNKTLCKYEKKPHKEQHSLRGKKKSLEF